MNSTGAHYILQTVCKCGSILYQCKVYPSDGKIERPLVQEKTRQLCNSCKLARKKLRFKLRLDRETKTLHNHVTA